MLLAGEKKPEQAGLLVLQTEINANESVQIGSGNGQVIFRTVNYLKSIPTG